MIFAIVQNTFREAVRNKILYSAVLFVALLIAGSALFGSVSIGSQIKVIKDFGLFSLSFFGAIVAIAAGVNLLNKELKQKTIYNILSKPVERWQFVLGKQIGLILTTSVLVSLSGLFFIGFTAMFEGGVDPLLFQGLYFTLLELVIVFCFGSLRRKVRARSGGWTGEVLHGRERPGNAGKRGKERRTDGRDQE